MSNDNYKIKYQYQKIDYLNTKNLKLLIQDYVKKSLQNSAET